MRLDHYETLPFAERTREVFREAVALRQRYQHRQLEVEHVLMALLAEGLISLVLDCLEVSHDALTQRLDVELKRLPKALPRSRLHTTHILSPRTTRLIRNARDEARRLRHLYVGSKHMLIAMCDEPGWVASQILRSFGVTKERVYQALDLRRSAGELREQAVGRPDEHPSLQDRVKRADERRASNASMIAATKSNDGVVELKLRIATLEEEVSMLQQNLEIEQREESLLRTGLQQARQQIATLELQNQHLRDMLKLTQENFVHAREMLEKEISLRHWFEQRRFEREAGVERTNDVDEQREVGGVWRRSE